ncbi:hypothetical protein FEM48_Zijuj07G0142900 [Ziziphus jujuba var. spinosa]|uniref:Release factor glutamine methyltransferase n=1 Tax=Ziziphus jujuba var. spinosa TaxID=714518 RepID=A0A978V545_ZIZJJ|nr:hypothetical protein FEM48_Zijuj07G0142900 [Ziziphus jujuba var. spinosa]
MRLSFTIGHGVPKFSLFLRPTLSRHLHRPIYSSSTLPSPTSQNPQTPLFLRPPTHRATFSDLRKWQNWAKTLALSVGSSFVDMDNGPDSTLLCRELKWLIEDVTEDGSISETLHNEEPERTVRLRVGLEELYKLWKQRIEERRPFQYIVGCEHWRDLILCVQEGVLIPRPETEKIVDLVGDLFSDNQGLREGLWADLGTGSGAIAIGIGMILRSSGRVIATDLSLLALEVATFNVQRYGLQVSAGRGKKRAVFLFSDVIQLRQGSWFEPLKDVEGKLAGIVSNPPYIPSDHISGLQAEVGRHEPRLALDGGVIGMNDLLHLCKGAASMLHSGGFFVFETNGEQQCKFLVEYMETEAGDNFYNVNIVPDFARVPRFVTGFRK